MGYCKILGPFKIKKINKKSDHIFEFENFSALTFHIWKRENAEWCLCSHNYLPRWQEEYCSHYWAHMSEFTLHLVSFREVQCWGDLRDDLLAEWRDLQFTQSCSDMLKLVYAAKNWVTGGYISTHPREKKNS